MSLHVLFNVEKRILSFGILGPENFLKIRKGVSYMNQKLKDNDEC